MKRIYLIAVVLFSLPFSFAKGENLFSDISEGSPYFVILSHLKEKNIIQGYHDNTFRPAVEVNRAEALTLIFRALEITVEKNGETQSFEKTQPVKIRFPKKIEITFEQGGIQLKKQLTEFEIEGTGKIFFGKSTAKRPFRDVASKAWYAPLLKKAVERGAVKGYSDGTFRPNQSINVVEALRMLHQSAGIKLDTPKAEELPTDVSGDKWYAADTAYAIARFHVIPDDHGRIFPNRTLSRGDLATILYRYLRSKEGASFGRASWYGDGLSKHKIPAAKDYIDNYLTAAHKEFQLGSIVKVKNLLNGKEVNVVINDRGPFVAGRIIDLSKTAFSALETPSVGVIPVEVELVKGP